MFKKVMYYGSTLVLNRICTLLPLRNRVLFLSDVREDLTGNFYYVSEYLKNHSDLEIVTSLKGDRRYKHTFKEWFQQVYYLSTCKYIMLDDYAESTAFLKVRNNQELVQLWHSSGIYKKFGHSRKSENGDLTRIHPGYKRYTKSIVSSEFCRPDFAEAFSIPVERVKATGIPRTDSFFDKEFVNNKKKEIYERYPQFADKKIVLVAPTYRGTKVEEADYDFSKFDLDRLYKEFGQEYIFIFKWHPALYNNIALKKVDGIDFSKYPGFVYDFSEYREINDLLLIADVLTTDYSSVIFDYIFMEKPIIFYAYDLQLYEEGRGLYYPFADYIYGKVSTNQEELISAIKDCDMCEDERKNFIMKFVEACDGNATEKTCKWIFDGDLYEA